MFVKDFSDLLGMHSHELVEFFCGYKLLGSGVIWTRHRVDQALVLHLTHACTQGFLGVMHAPENVFDGAGQHILFVDRLLRQAVVQMPAGQCI